MAAAFNSLGIPASSLFHPCIPFFALSSGDHVVDHWDPMASDYGSADFNTYTSGVGSLLPTGRGGGEEKKDISLFVTNIPVGLTKVCVVVRHSAMQNIRDSCDMYRYVNCFIKKTVSTYRRVSATSSPELAG